MAELIIGLQGSGKSFNATHRIFTDKDKYDKILTDIDGLKVHDNVYALDFPSFIVKAIKPCYEMLVKDIDSYEDVEDLTEEQIFKLITSNNTSFQNAIDYLKRIYVLPQNASKENRILLIVDEAQNYFGKTVKLNAFLLWFITQHRHLYMEIYLITQDHTLIRPDYKLFNIIYKALPPAKQVINGSFIYKQYAGFPLNDDNFVKRIVLKKDEKVFDMYESGDKVESPNVLKKFIILFIVFASMLGGGIYYFTSVYGHTSTKTIEAKKQTTNSNDPPKIKYSHTQSKNITYEHDEDDKLYTLVVFKDRFYIQGIGDTDDYPLKLLLYIKDNYFKTVIDKIKRDDFHTVIYAICNSSLENLFKKEKDTKQSFGEQTDVTAVF